MPTQAERLLSYLEENPSIGPMDGWRKLGIYRLADAAYRLRKDGHLIQTEYQNIFNQFGEQCRVARYSLAKPDPVPEGMLL